MCVITVRRATYLLLIFDDVTANMHSENYYAVFVRRILVVTEGVEEHRSATVDRFQRLHQRHLACNRRKPILTRPCDQASSVPI